MEDPTGQKELILGVFWITRGAIARGGLSI
jgi:hypothetical protein